jgi:hypothetical protein
MHAIQPPQPSFRPTPPIQRSRVRFRQNNSKHTHRAVAFEASAKLIVNLVLAIAAGSAICKLLPYSLSQQTKLQELRAEVGVVEGRVTQLQTNFSHNFDPHMARSVMQEQSSRIDPHQRPIVWLTPANGTTAPTP